MRKKDNEAGDAQDFTGLPASTVVSPADIQSKEFSVSRFGGYRMRDVDEFLDQITGSMTKLTEENERLRSGAGLPAAPSIGAPDLADTSRQADEIIERARAEAATIVQDARAQAAAASGAAVAVGAGTDAGRAAVAPFLSQERDFLQQLATLVQSHAESVKDMAKAGRAKPAAATTPPSSSASPAAAPEASPAAAPGASEPRPSQPRAERPAPRTSTSEATQAMAPVQPGAAPPVSSSRDTTPPIRVEEPATASVSAGDADDEGGGQGEGGDRTLRELFWGEE